MHGRATQALMAWAGVTRSFRTNLIFMTRGQLGKKKGYSGWSYKKVLREGVLPCIERVEAFRQNSASIHVAKETQD